MTDQIKIGIGADSSGAVQNIDKVNASLGNMGKGAEESGGKAKGLSLDFSELNQAMEVGSKVAEAVKQVYAETVDKAVKLGDATESLSRLTGASSQESSKLLGVTQILGISQDTLSIALQGAIKKGYSPTLDGLKAIKEQYNAIQDPIQKVAYLQDTFGKSGEKLAEFMETDTATLDKYAEHVTAAGLVIDKDGVEKAQQYSRTLEESKQVWDGLTTQIGMAVIPSLTDLGKTFVDVADKENTEHDGWTRFIPVYGQIKQGIDWITAATQGSTKAATDNFDALSGLTTAHETLIPIIGGTTKNMDDLSAADQNATIAAADFAQTQREKALAALQDTKDAASKLSFEMGNLTTQTLYNVASAGLDANASLDLATKLGLIDPASKNAYEQLTALKAAHDAGTLSSSAYALAVKALNDQLNGIHDVSATVTINNVTVDNYSKSGKKGSGSYAIGGVGGGDVKVGEDGPEMVHLPPGSQIVNNYDYRTTYELQAHYANYQDPHSARNDMVGLTMLKNAGAAKWAH